MDYTGNVAGERRVLAEFIAADYDGTIVRTARPDQQDVCSPYALGPRRHTPSANRAPPPTIEDPFDGAIPIMSVVAARGGAWTCATAARCN